MIINNKSIIIFITLLTGFIVNKTAAAASRSKNGIAPYSDSCDRHAVRAIARANVAHLVSAHFGPTFNYSNIQLEYDKLLEAHIMPTLTDKSIINKVYLCDQKPVAFINYTMYIPWHRCLHNATILHLAVEPKNKGKRYGSILLDEAICDCRRRSVDQIELWTTGGTNLEEYYRKFGFLLGYQTKFGERNFRLVTQPSPLPIVFVRRALRLLLLRR